MSTEVFNSYKRKSDTDLFKLAQEGIGNFYSDKNIKHLDSPFFSLFEIAKRKVKRQLRDNDDFLHEELALIASEKLIITIKESVEGKKDRLKVKTIPAYFGKVVWGTVVDKQRTWYSKPKNGQRIYEISNLLHNYDDEEEADYSDSIYFKYNAENILESTVDLQIQKNELVEKIEKKIKKIFNSKLLEYDDCWKWVIISNAIKDGNNKIFDKLPYRERMLMKLISFEVKEFIYGLSELRR